MSHVGRLLSTSLGLFFNYPMFSSITFMISLFPLRFWLPRWLSGKESTCQCWRQRRLRFYPWVRKIPWRRTWQPTSVFLPGESHGQRSLVGCCPWGRRVRRNWASTHSLWYTWNLLCCCKSLKYQKHQNKPNSETNLTCSIRWSLGYKYSSVLLEFVVMLQIGN